MLLIIVLIALITIAAFIFLQQKSFGKKPQGKRLERIEKSPNYKKGRFVNLSETPAMSADASYLQLVKLYWQNDSQTEPGTLPSIKADLTTAPSHKPTLTWFGHSTLLIQVKGKNILVDPVFSERASPVQYLGSKSYSGTRVYSIEDLPRIDMVLLSHDHYDHLDVDVMDQLKSRAGKFYVPLGVGSHLEYWGVDSTKITEFDWWEGEHISADIKLIATPARHFSGRGITDRNKTLWTSYVLITPEYRIYIGGDSGYDTHFKEIGEKYGPFDLVILESGQYHEYWPYIHMMPEETVQASIDLKGKVLLPVHWGKFTLALHSWNEPVNRVLKKAEELNVKITTPMIGEKIIIDSVYPDKRWWMGL